MHGNNPQIPVSTFNIGTSAYQTFTAIKHPVMRLTIFGILIPLFMFEVLLSKPSEQAGNLLKSLAEQSLKTGTSFNYRVFLEVSATFFSHSLLGLGLLALILFSAYMGIIYLASNHHRGNKPLSASSAFWWGLSQFFPKGLLMLLALFLISSMERILWGPFRILAMFALMTPVLYTKEGMRFRQSLNRSLFLKFINPQISSGFNTALTLVVFGALVFFLESLVNIGWKYLLNMDLFLGLQRDFFIIPFFNLPFTLIYFVTTLLAGFFYSLLFISLPLFTTELYTRIVKPLF